MEKGRRSFFDILSLVGSMGIAPAAFWVPLSVAEIKTFAGRETIAISLFDGYPFLSFILAVGSLAVFLSFWLRLRWFRWGAIVLGSISFLGVSYFLIQTLYGKRMMEAAKGQLEALGSSLGMGLWGSSSGFSTLDLLGFDISFRLYYEGIALFGFATGSAILASVLAMQESKGTERVDNET